MLRNFKDRKVSNDNMIWILSQIHSSYEILVCAKALSKRQQRSPRKNSGLLEMILLLLLLSGITTLYESEPPQL
jgi:hypothetical protein